MESVIYLATGNIKILLKIWVTRWLNEGCNNL